MFINSTSNATSLQQNCVETIHLYRNVNKSWRSGIISGYFILSGILGILINSLLVFLIVRTKQNRNQSMKILMYGSIIGIMNGCISCIHCLQLLIDMSCFEFISTNILKLFSVYFSGYFTLIVVLDRYIRVKYCNEYEQVFTPNKLRILIGFVLFLTISFSIATPIVNYNYGSGSAIPFTFSFNLMIFVLGIVLYILSVKKLSSHAENHRDISASNRNIVKFIKIHFFIFILGHGFIIFVHQGLLRFLSLFYKHIIFQYREEIACFLITNYNLPTLIGIINAVVLMIVNNKIRNVIKSRISSREEGS